MKKFIFFLLVFQITIYKGYNQQVVDSLKRVTYDYMWERFYADTTKRSRLIYTDAIIARTKKEGDTSTLLGGYTLRSYLYEDETYISYLDSIIALSKDKPLNTYPDRAYLDKGAFYYGKGLFKESFDHLMMVREKVLSNPRLSFRLNYYIGAIKLELGDEVDALQVYKSCLNYLENNNRVNSKVYLQVLFNISTIYNRLKKPDSAKIFIERGITKAGELKQVELITDFKINKGIALYYKEMYDDAKDILITNVDSLKFVEDKIDTFLYLGRTFDKISDKKEAIKYYKKADSIIGEIKINGAIYRPIYTSLIEFYKSKNDLKNQFKYLNKLITLDSINHSNELYLNKNLYTQYEIPRLKSERDLIINSIQAKDKEKQVWIFFLMICIVFIVVISINQFQKKKSYKKKFIALMNDKEISGRQKSLEVKSTFKVPEDSVVQILKNLNNFEKTKDYLTSTITLPFLAKKLGTNSKYLSRVITDYKKKNFINYINGLRIDYCVEKLKVDSQFRNYTLLAIANDIGFKKVESFSKAFKKATGITPFYFIEELRKRE